MHPTEQLGPTWDCSSWDQRTIGIVAAGTSLEFNAVGTILSWIRCSWTSPNLGQYGKLGPMKAMLTAGLMAAGPKTSF